MIIPARPNPAEIVLAIAGAFVVQTTLSATAACVPILAPEIAQARGWDVNYIAVYLPIVYLAAFVVSFVVPRLLLLWGGMGLAVICLFLGATGIMLLLVPLVVLVFAGPVAIGLATGSMNPASSQILGPRTSPRNAGFVMSLKQTGVPMGAILAGALTPILVLYAGWQRAIVMIALGNTAIAVCCLPLVYWLSAAEEQAPKKYRPLEPLKQLVSIPGMPRLMVAATLFVAVQLCLRSFFTVYLVRYLGLPLIAAGFFFSFSQAAGVVGQIGWAVLADRVLSPHRVMAIIGGLMCLGAGLAAGLTPAWPSVCILIAAVLLGLTAAGFIPVVLGEVVRRSGPGEAGALTSGANMFLISGFLLGPLGFGGLALTFGYRNAFVALALCAGVGGLIMSDAGAAARRQRLFRRVATSSDLDLEDARNGETNAP